MFYIISLESNLSSSHIQRCWRYPYDITVQWKWTELCIALFACLGRRYESGFFAAWTLWCVSAISGLSGL